MRTAGKNRLTNRRHYTPADLYAVRLWYRFTGAAPLARKIGRTKQAINSLAARLGERRLMRKT